jgi:sugar-phosphatase
MKQLQCDAVIFDLDGVLVDSMVVIERHWRQWAIQHNFDAAEIMRVAHGRRTVETIRLVAPHLDAEVEAARFEAGEAFDTDGLVRIDGAARLVRSLPSSSWAVATSCTRDTAMTRLRYAGLPMPTVLVTADDVKQGKPDPEVYLLAAERLDVAPEWCVVVEDALAGIEAAHAAGMHVIAVATTHAQEELESADAVAAYLSDIQILPKSYKSKSSEKLPNMPMHLTVRCAVRR